MAYGQAWLENHGRVLVGRAFVGVAKMVETNVKADVAIKGIF